MELLHILPIKVDHPYAAETPPHSPGKERSDHLDSVAHVVQHAVVDGLADVAHRPLRVGGGNDLVRARCVFISRKDTNFTSGHLLFMDVHRLQAEDSARDVKDDLINKEYSRAQAQ